MANLLISSTELKKRAKIHEERGVMTLGRKTSSGLLNILKRLRDIESQFLKHTTYARWNELFLLSLDCEKYLNYMRENNRDVRSERAIVITRLSVAAVEQMMKEKNKAQQLGVQIRQGQSGPGIGMGVNNPGHANVKFELGLKGVFKSKPGLEEKVVHGGDLYKKALESGQVRFTGDTGHDAFVLRSWLKNLAKQDNGFATRNLNLLDYFSENTRAKHEIKFNGNLAYQNGQLLDTTNSVSGTENWASPYVISPDGEWYTKTGPFDPGTLHHSSFLAGGQVSIAGTIRCVQGRVQYITNNSGHYSPTFDNIIDACDGIINSGIDNRIIDRLCFCYMDFEGKFGGQKNDSYLFGLRQLARYGHRLPNPAAYRIFPVRFAPGVLHWEVAEGRDQAHPCGVNRNTDVYVTDSGNKRLRVGNFNTVAFPV